MEMIYFPLLMPAEQDGQYSSAVLDEWRTFSSKLSDFSPEVRLDFRTAFKITAIALEGQMRLTNDDLALSHSIEVASILVGECGITEPTVIKAAILHDVIEDSKFFGDPTKMPYQEWVQHAGDLLEDRGIDEDTVRTVQTLTKPQVNNIDFFNKDEARNAYYEKLRNANPDVIVVKMADRLHNLRTEYETTPEQRERKVKETREIYFPIFTRAIEDAPEYRDVMRYLLGQINRELTALEEGNRFITADESENGVIFSDEVAS